MNIQRAGQQRQCGGGLRLDLSSQLFLIVQIAAFLNRLPREVITVREQTWIGPRRLEIGVIVVR